MTRSSLARALVVAAAFGVPRVSLVYAQPSELAGRWSLDRALSQLPREIGFNANWVPTPDSSAPAGTAGRGRRPGPPVADAFGAKPESEDDAKRLQQLTAEARSPAGFLTIAETPSAISIENDQGPPRTFHADGREEVIQLDGVPVAAIASGAPS